MNSREKYSSFTDDKKSLDNENQPGKDYFFNKNPKNPKITTSLEKHNFIFKLKSLKYLIKQDKSNNFLKLFKKRPFFYLKNLFTSYLKSKPYIQSGDNFLFNIATLEILKDRLKKPDVILLFALSYCQRPKECKEKRFSSDCKYDPISTVCSQCFLGKCANLIQKTDKFLIVPDVKFIGDTIFEILNNEKDKEIIFVVSACDLSIKMFADFANILKIKGIGIKLQGRVCLNFETFLHAEKGLKNSLTNLSNDSESLMLELLKTRNF
ncbi:MAG: hypothetical protein JXA94_01930 [Parachlamydiales bacterium]|nr:hypothetical protein [Parachlamydiales bacterium]